MSNVSSWYLVVTPTAALTPLPGTAPMTALVTVRARKVVTAQPDGPGVPPLAEWSVSGQASSPALAAANLLSEAYASASANYFSGLLQLMISQLPGNVLKSAALSLAPGALRTAVEAAIAAYAASA